MLPIEDTNAAFRQADVALILGANDAVNAALLHNGAPGLNIHLAKTIIWNTRTPAKERPGPTNQLFYLDKALMVLGDTKHVVEELCRALAMHFNDAEQRHLLVLASHTGFTDYFGVG